MVEMSLNVLPLLLSVPSGFNHRRSAQLGVCKTGRGWVHLSVAVAGTA